MIPEDEIMQKNWRAAENAIKWSEEDGLLTEVFIWSLMAMKANPELEIHEAIQEGFDEWDK